LGLLNENSELGGYGGYNVVTEKDNDYNAVTEVTAVTGEMDPECVCAMHTRGRGIVVTSVTRAHVFYISI
jgi:hypothetical protein